MMYVRSILPKRLELAVIGLTRLLLEVIWTLGLWIRKTVECSKCCFMDHSSRSMEDSGAKYDLNCEAWLERIQRRRI